MHLMMQFTTHVNIFCKNLCGLISRAAIIISSAINTMSLIRDLEIGREFNPRSCFRLHSVFNNHYKRVAQNFRKKKEYYARTRLKN